MPEKAWTRQPLLFSLTAPGSSPPLQPHPPPPPGAGSPPPHRQLLSLLCQLEKEFSALPGERAGSRGTGLLPHIRMLSLYEVLHQPSYLVLMEIGEAWLGPVHCTLVHSQSVLPGHPFCHFLGFPLLHKFLGAKTLSSSSF